MAITQRQTAIERARTRVFDITELFENILLQLPIRYLLINATRVSRHWKALIDNSARLQQALFFRPLPGPSVRFDYTRHRFLERTTDREVVVLINPLLYRNRNALMRYLHGVDSDRALARDDASWRRMLVFQPPLRTVRFRSCGEVKYATAKRGHVRFEHLVLPVDDHFPYGLEPDEMLFVEHVRVADGVRRVVVREGDE